MNDIKKRRREESEKRRQAMKRERKKREGEIIAEIKRTKKTYSQKSKEPVILQRGPIHRGKSWYSH